MLLGFGIDPLERPRLHGNICNTCELMNRLLDKMQWLESNENYKWCKLVEGTSLKRMGQYWWVENHCFRELCWGELLILKVWQLHWIASSTY